MTRHATVVGAGLAGAEAAWMLARYGIPTALYEMKPVRFSPAITVQNADGMTIHGDMLL